MPGPLEGIRVLEVANWLAVPGCAALLTDLGAETIKVEQPGGDGWRGFLAHADRGHRPIVRQCAFELLAKLVHQVHRDTAR